MEIINLTPHPINLYDHQLKLVKTFPNQSKNPPRLDEFISGEVKHNVNGCLVTVVKKHYEPHTKLPQEKDGIIYIVPYAIAAAHPDRIDLVVPDLILRDETGKILGCRRFAMVAKG